MALRVAIASGNWSNPAIWNGGVLPAAGDLVASNTYTVTIDQNINVDSLTNIAQSIVDAIPLMTSNTTPSGVARSNTGVAFQAFDRSSSYWIAQVTVAGDYVEYEFPTPKAIDQYYFTNGTTFTNGSVSLQAWNGSTWITLHTASSVTLPNAGNYTYTSPLIGNSTAYLKYRFVVNSAFYVQIHTVGMYEYLGTSSATAGGGFILNSGVTVTCTSTGDGIYNVAGFICVDYTAASGTSTINANIRGRDGTSVFCVRKSGAGTLNINGTLRGLFSTNGNGGALQITGTGTVTITGNIQEPSNGGQTVQIDASSTLNVIGSVFAGPYNGQQTIKVNANNCTINVTGNIVAGAGGSTGWSTAPLQTNGSNTTINLSGDIDATNGNSASKYGLVVAGANNVINHTGNIIGSSDNVGGGVAFYTTQVIYYNQIGYIKPSLVVAGFVSTSSSSIHILTGPFISSVTGIQPLSLLRMHYRRTMGSYFEFRDNSTNGALPPSAPAPATRLVSPDTVADSPIPANVRQGVVYAAGSQTGTMVVPSRDNVAKGVLVDNTTGTAVLDADAIWAVPLTSINTLNSIGRRVKNAATVETTAAQIQTTLNNNE